MTETETITQTGQEIRAGGVVAGRYRLDSELGRGGFAVTWRATELTSGRVVAVKVLSLRAVDHWKAVEAFEREARILKSIAHPAIPKYVELIAPQSADSDVFILVQEMVPGRSLAERMKSGWRPDEKDIKNVAERILGALEYLHRLVPPVIHRDIKPGNIIVDDSGKVSLIDFGSVRDRLARESELGSIAGTFGYMAPEQLSGTATPQSDLYSLGATLVELATRHAPAEIPQRELKLDFAHLTNLSPGMTAWLGKLVEPLPEKRFASARAALDALYRGGIRAKTLGALQTEDVAVTVEEDALQVDVHAQPKLFSWLLGGGALTGAVQQILQMSDKGIDTGSIILTILGLLFAFLFFKRGVGSIAKTRVRLDGDGVTVDKRIGPIRYAKTKIPASEKPTLAGNRRDRDLVVRSRLGTQRVAKNLGRNLVLAIEQRAQQQNEPRS